MVIKRVFGYKNQDDTSDSPAFNQNIAVKLGLWLAEIREKHIIDDRLEMSISKVYDSLLKYIDVADIRVRKGNGGFNATKFKHKELVKLCELLVKKGVIKMDEEARSWLYKRRDDVDGDDDTSGEESEDEFATDFNPWSVSCCF